MINAALILDGKELIGLNEQSLKDLNEIIERSGTDVNGVMKHTVKFMRALNKVIVENGTFYNTEDRVVYRGVPLKILKNVKKGDCFRMLNYACTSEDEATAESFKTTSQDSSKIVIKVKAWCYNAGQINKFGKSSCAEEKETLIPPYSYFKCTKIVGNTFYLTLAQDNLNHPIHNIKYDA